MRSPLWGRRGTKGGNLRRGGTPPQLPITVWVGILGRAIRTFKSVAAAGKTTDTACRATATEGYGPPFLTGPLRQGEGDTGGEVTAMGQKKNQEVHPVTPCPRPTGDAAFRAIISEAGHSVEYWT